MSESLPDLSTTPRLYVAGALAAGAELRLEGGQAHYLGQVMRRQVGDFVRVFDGVHGEWAARVVSVEKRAVLLAVVAQSGAQEVVPDIWLCFAPLKRGRVDWLVEKACELGVARLLPVVTRRTIVDRVNGERLRAHLVEAAEQCGRTFVPELAEMVALPALLAGWPLQRTLYFADEALAGDAGAPRLADVAGAGPAAILIGPEGGFMETESEAIRNCKFARPVSLGPRILRADTAALAALAVWQGQNDG